MSWAQCSACGLTFASDQSFDRHRAGSFGNGRRCFTTAELLEQGWRQNRYGYWTHREPMAVKPAFLQTPLPAVPHRAQSGPQGGGGRHHPDSKSGQPYSESEVAV